MQEIRNGGNRGYKRWEEDWERIEGETEERGRNTETGGGEERSERGRAKERRNESSRKQADAGEQHSALSDCLSLLLRISAWKYWRRKCLTL